MTAIILLLVLILLKPVKLSNLPQGARMGNLIQFPGRLRPQSLPPAMN